MEKKRFKIPNISCGHCVMTIKRELGEMEGVSRVEGDPESKTIEVHFEEPADLEGIKGLLKEINYSSAGEVD
jgi:copper chaperone CopZ